MSFAAPEPDAWIARRSLGPRLLVVDDDVELLDVLAGTLRSNGFAVETAVSVESALPRFAEAPPAAALVDVRLPGRDGYEFLSRARAMDPRIPIVMLSANDGLDDATKAVKLGAVDYLVKPVDPTVLSEAVRRALQLAAGEAQSTSAAFDAEAEAMLGGSSPAMEEVRRKIARVAATPAPVLITGEVGAGKEVAARALHVASRRPGPFVVVSAASLTEEFTEAASPREVGPLERAAGGTLVLDEITEMRPDMQARLLRVLQYGVLAAQDGSPVRRLDLRVVATSSRDINEAIVEGRLRQDLLFWLDVVRLEIPPLRSRPTDIPVLVQEMLHRAAVRFGQPLPPVDPDAMAALQRHRWSGNVRQLEQAIQRAVVLAGPEGITASSFSWLEDASAVPPVPSGSMGTVAAGSAARQHSRLPTMELRALERMAILDALRATQQNRTRAAGLLGINVRSLRRILNADPSLSERRR